MQSTKANFMYRLFLLAIVIILSPLQVVNAAQSTVDAVADDKMKEQLRSEVIGNVTFPGEEKEYVVGHGDILGVNVYGEGDMAAAPTASSRPATPGEQQQQAQSQEQPRGSGSGAVVRPDGRISLLHVGDVHVVGMTLTQLADYLKKLYSTVYSNPLVSAVLVQSNSRRYTVMGQVAHPGVFYLDFPINIVQSIARSGGFTEWANHDITVVRAGDGVKTQAAGQGKNTIEFDYDDVMKGKNLEKNVYIQSGDIIIVH